LLSCEANVFNHSGAIRSLTIACVVQLWMLDLLTKHPVLLKRGSVSKAGRCEFLSVVAGLQHMADGSGSGGPGGVDPIACECGAPKKIADKSLGLSDSVIANKLQVDTTLTIGAMEALMVKLHMKDNSAYLRAVATSEEKPAWDTAARFPAAAVASSSTLIIL
jgi:hypothetical protein